MFLFVCVLLSILKNYSIIFVKYNISLFNDVWSLEIKFALLTRVLVVDNFTCSGWFDEKWVYWPVWVSFLHAFVIISLFSFSLMMQTRNGKFSSDAFCIVNSMFSTISFNFCNVSPRSCDVIVNFLIVIFLINNKWHSNNNTDSWIKAHLFTIQSWTKYMGQTLVFMWNSAIWENFNLCFSAVFC